MFRLYVAFFLIITLLGTHSVLAQSCRDNDINTERSDPIYISEFRVSLEPSNCPDAIIDLSEPIEFERNEFVQFWIRLQGSEKYLDSRSSTKSFEFRFFRLSGNSLVPFDVLSVGGIRKKTAKAEALANRGRFDWRMWVRKQMFFRPGTYSISVYQNGGEICFHERNTERTCAHEFRVR